MAAGNIRRRRHALRCLLLTVGAALLAAALLVNHFGAPANPHDPTPVTVTIPAGAGTGQIARILQQQRLVRSGLYFRSLARVRGLDGKLQAGEYSLSAVMPPAAILNKIVQGDIIKYPVTVPEGYTVQQTAQVFADAGFAAAAEFLRQAREIAPPYAPARTGVREPLEGYLFPDTYYLNKGMDEAAILKLMLDRLQEVITPAWAARAGELGYTVPEIITIASLVEKEAKLSEERGVIAGVIYNRLRQGMSLQIDASVLYALGETKTDVLLKDLEKDSPYNTYLYPGLPPGPIANPGKAALYAALYPEETPYYYYVAKGDGSGSHIFSRTYAEHLRAKSQARGR